jgi:DNA uptake protein ComE-like DNA-binding protein
MVMAMKIDAGGVTIESYGTQQFPVEASGNSEFVNILNEITTDIGTIDDTTIGLARIVNQTSREVDALQTTVGNLGTTVSSLSTRMGTAEGNITTQATTISGINTRLTTLENASLPSRVGTLESQMASTMSSVSAMSVSSSSGLATVNINGNTVSQLVQKSYIDGITGGSAVVKLGTLYYGMDSVTDDHVGVIYIGDAGIQDGIFIKYGLGNAGGFIYFSVSGGTLHRFDTSDLNRHWYQYWRFDQANN